MIFRDSPAVNVLEERRQTRLSIRCFNSGRLLRAVLSVILPILPVFPALAQEKETADDSDAPAVETSFKPAAVFYEPNNRRDPFFHYTPPKKTAPKDTDTDGEIPRGAPPSGITGTFIEKAGLEGIVVRSNNQRMAVIRGADNRAYFLREGDRLFDGYLETIQDDSVVFVRETFMRSGKILTQEVTKRLRKS